MRKQIAAAVAAVGGLALLAGCTGSGAPEAVTQEQKFSRKNFRQMQNNQPAASMKGYSPTRETLNKWVKTWREKGQMAYVYLMTPQGEIVSYAVLSSLPASYCAAQHAPYNLLEFTHDGDEAPDMKVPSPAIDGVYRSGSVPCDRMFGFDATTGQYVEWSTNEMTYLLSNRPLPVPDTATSLGPTTIEKARRKAGQ